MLRAFTYLRDDARIWFFPFDRDLTADELRLLGEVLDTFMPEWNAHGTTVTGAWAVIGNRIAVIAGQCEELSGCSIDSMFNVIKEFAGKIGAGLSGGMDIIYRDGSGGIAAVKRSRFRNLVAGGLVSPRTRVFDLTHRTLGELRRRPVESRFADSWHAHTFGTPLAPGSEETVFGAQT